MCEEEGSKMGSGAGVWPVAGRGPISGGRQRRVVSGMLQLLTFIGGDLGCPPGAQYSAGSTGSIEK